MKNSKKLWPESALVTQAPFVVGSLYSRKEVASVVKAVGSGVGGNWATGYVEHDQEFLLFVNVATSGRTGHDYGNRWIDACTIEWRAKTKTRLSQPQIQRLLLPSAKVHFFGRDDNRCDFTYYGLCCPKNWFDETPVRVHWTLLSLMKGEHSNNMIKGR